MKKDFYVLSYHIEDVSLIIDRKSGSTVLWWGWQHVQLPLNTTLKGDKYIHSLRRVISQEVTMS